MKAIAGDRCKIYKLKSLYWKPTKDNRYINLAENVTNSDITITVLRRLFNQNIPNDSIIIENFIKPLIINYSP